MANLFPTDPKRIRERIRRYERALRKELEAGYGGGGDGKRFLLGTLYMLMGDVDGALASFDRYKDVYPDDSGDPYQYLTRALALFRGGRKQEAFNKLYQTMVENLYLVPVLLGRSAQRLDIWHGSKLAWIEYAVDVPQALLNIWDDVALQWAREVSEHPAVLERVARCIAIHRELERESPGPRRSALVDEAFALKKTTMPLQ